MYQIGVGWFAAASLLCALAPSIEWLIAGRLLQGIGGALLLLTVGPLLIAGGMLWFSGVGPGDGYLTAVLPGVLIFGFGLAVRVAPVTATALGTVPAERAGA